MNWYGEVWKKYAVFKGRARRKEYWMFFLISSIIALVLGIGESEFDAPNYFSGFYTLAAAIPGTAVAVRRLHDTNRSGWWLLIGLIPLIGGIVLTIFWVQDSQSGENQYGPNPKVAMD